ncbi:MAG: YdiU family protein [Myxococcota bacterium]
MKLDWTFDDRFVRENPGDPDDSRVPRPVFNAAYSRIDPEPISNPERLAWVPKMAEAVGLDPNVEATSIASVLTGNVQLPTMKPYAACYGGHQFGSWAGQLGDGRAITLGEAIGPDGQRLEVQLKGAGRTPYSRGADGRAVLRSSIREFLCAEAMHHLGIPTTRSLALCTTGESVMRDMFYDGRAAPEPGAIVARVSPSFLRFGSYQIFASRDDVKTLTTLVRHTLRHHFPDLATALPSEGPIPEPIVLAWASEVGRRSQALALQWQRVGFVHGVLNTDNMSVLGLTIDYGPYGWLDVYDPDFTPNTTDLPHRRYRYAQQPLVVMWNLARFLEATVPLFDDPQPLQGVLDAYRESIGDAWTAMMRSKLGLQTVQDEDSSLIDACLELMGAAETDWTLFFRGLAEVSMAEGVDSPDRIATLRPAFYAEPDAELVGRWSAWVDRYAARVRAEGAPADRTANMNQVNPAFLLRNHLVQVAIDRATEGDLSEVHRLQALLADPYRVSPDATPSDLGRQPTWARDKPGCGMLSCSS